MMLDRTRIAASVSILLVIVLGIVSISTTSWVETTENGAPVYLGLFTGCTPIPNVGTYVCVSLPSIFFLSWWMAVQGLAVSHVILQVLAAIALFIGLMQEKKMMAYIGTIMTWIAGTLLVVANAVFAANVVFALSEVQGTLGYSYYLSCVAAVFGFMAKLCALRASRAIPGTASFSAFY